MGKILFTDGMPIIIIGDKNTWWILTTMYR